MDPNSSSTALYDASRNPLERLEDVKQSRSKSGSSVSSGRDRLGHYYNTYVNRMVEAGSDPNSSEIISFPEFCATYIQDWWRKLKADEKALDQIAERVASETYLPLQPHTPLEAAKVIQRAWRKHIDIQVYRYYRDLINFKQKGDPALMLKCINPNEAKYLDVAAGVHIKFRLAGDRFPPNIYYKIFTHRPIQDLCANSPKVYTAAGAKRLMGRDVHNKGDRVPAATTSGWYLRCENNGWRLVSDRILTHVMSDPITWETSKKKINFSHNKLVRQADIERKKKRKKIDWMKTMYKEGMLKAKVTDKETINLIEGAAAGMVATVDAHGPSAVQDWEVDELLDWTTGLNFEDYWTGWRAMATSDASDTYMRQERSFYKQETDPFELSIAQNVDLSRLKNETRQSHNTPVSNQSQNTPLTNMTSGSSRSPIDIY